MGMSLGDLFTSGLLILNAIAVLHEERFLAKRRRRPCPPCSLRAAAARLTRVWPRRACVPRSTSLSPPPPGQRAVRAQPASALGAGGTRLCTHACGALRDPRKALPCPATPSGRPHGTFVSHVADGWSTNSLEVTLNPTTLKSKVLLTLLPAPGSVGHCLALLPPLAT
jgi:hypothetical protein